MKKYLMFLMLLSVGYGALAQSTPAEQVANRIADRLRDSLSLNTTQRSRIYDINMQLHGQKMNVRQQHAQGEWTALIQRIENTRDSLYRPVLGDEKYQQYKQKKTTLISSN